MSRLRALISLCRNRLLVVAWILTPVATAALVGVV
jgi:hypothetical protein